MRDFPWRKKVRDFIKKLGHTDNSWEIHYPRTLPMGQDGIDECRRLVRESDVVTVLIDSIVTPPMMAEIDEAHKILGLVRILYYFTPSRNLESHLDIKDGISAYDYWKQITKPISGPVCVPMEFSDDFDLKSMVKAALNDVGCIKEIQFGIYYTSRAKNGQGRVAIEINGVPETTIQTDTFYETIHRAGPMTIIIKEARDIGGLEKGTIIRSEKVRLSQPGTFYLSFADFYFKPKK